jgi:hypothetical protein
MVGRDDRGPIQIDEQQMKKNPLWNHAVLLERAGDGGNARWCCKYCMGEFGGSYSSVKSHLHQIQIGGIKICMKVTKSIQAQLNSEVAKAKEGADESKDKDLLLPTARTQNVRGGGSTGYPVRKHVRSSAIEKAFDMETRITMDVLIARFFYPCGLSFNIGSNLYYREAFKFVANHNLSGYVPPSYNKLRTTLLKQERAHVETLLNRIKSVWQEKGVTICSDGWTDAQRRSLINFIAVSEISLIFL